MLAEKKNFDMHNGEKIMAELKAALDLCQAEKQKLDAARLTLTNRKNAIADARRKSDGLTGQAEQLRGEISEAAGRGIDISDKVSLRAKILGELQVLRDMQTDLETDGVVKAEETVRITLGAYTAAVVRRLNECTAKFQGLLDEKVIEVAREIDLYCAATTDLARLDHDVACMSWRSSLMWRPIRPSFDEKGHVNESWR